MNFKNIIVEKKDGIAKITMNRPEKLNAITLAMEDEINGVIEQLDKDDSVSVIIITGAGRAFSAGRDLNDAEAGNLRSVYPGPGGPWKPIEDAQKPVIAAINGICYTGGMTLIYSCDIIIASEKAVFADAHARYGLGGGSPTVRLPRIVGAYKAKEILFTCQPLSAREAERIGLVNKVVPADKLEKTAIEMAKNIIKNSQRSVRFMKSLVNQGMMVDMGTASEMAASKSKVWRDKRTANEVKEAETRIGAFIEKRQIE